MALSPDELNLYWVHLNQVKNSEMMTERGEVYSTKYFMTPKDILMILFTNFHIWHITSTYTHCYFNTRQSEQNGQHFVVTFKI